MRVILADKAKKDVEELLAFISDGDPAAARRIKIRITMRFSALSRYATMGRPGRVKGTRELSITKTPYLAVYSITGRRVEILRVLHSRQKWP